MADLAITLRRAAPGLADSVRPGLSLTVERGLGIAKLRIVGAQADDRFAATCGTAPPAPRTQVDHAGLTFAWLAPGEWLATGPESRIAGWTAQAATTGDVEMLAIDITHARTAFVLHGTQVRTALAAHCPLDLWPGTFATGAVARSLLGATGMFVARLADADGEPRFRVIVDQTMAPYAGRLFARSGAEGHGIDPLSSSQA